MIDSSKFYATTPIYYVNAKPHLGHLYSTVLADVAARLHKIAGKETYLLTGTDEHGQKIAQAAQAAGKTPHLFVENLADEFRKLFTYYQIDYNHFLRTTDDSHMKGVTAWILELIAKGDIYKNKYTGWYCVQCETFVQEKLHADTAPSCVSCQRITSEVSEECYFFRLSNYQDRLLDFYKEHPEFVTPSERLNEVISFVQSGLKDLCISRTTVAWGIPFPGDAQHTVYVWADALNNYLTGIGYGDPQRQSSFRKWWPADLQVMGKDIIRFHAVYWPAFLMASQLPLPRTLLVHGWFKVGDQKMSKSLGNAIDPFNLAQEYGVDAVRYYLTRYMAITQDSPFSTEELEARVNADLANDLGNLINRVLALALKHNLQEIAPIGQLSSAELDLRDKLWTMLNDFTIELEEYYFHRAYAHVWKFIGQVNAYFHAQEPWKLAKTDPNRFKQVISATCHSLTALALLIWPVMPQKMEELLNLLGIEREPGVNYFERLSIDPWLKTFVVKPAQPLFVRIERPVASSTTVVSTGASINASTGAAHQETISIQDLAKIELRVGTITSCQEIPKSEKLYVMQVDFGQYGTRQICAGVRQSFTPEELLAKQAVFVFNLPVRSLMGYESQGMMLVAPTQDPAQENRVVLISPQEPVANGSLLR